MSVEKPMESLAEIFRCFICMEKLRDAHMCPHCSKLCCFLYCRSTLHIHEIVNCRWAEEVTQQLDTLQHQPTSNKKSSTLSLLDAESETEKCSTHIREELSVYCSTCKCCICHECALWSSIHTGHVFKPLDEIYIQHCQQIKEHVTRLRRKFLEIISHVQDIEKNIDFIRTAKDQRVREMRNAVELMIARLDNLLKNKLMTLVNQKGHLNRKSEEMEELLREIECQMTSGAKSELIKNCGKIQKKIQDAINKSNFSLAPVSADFQSELVPFYEHHTFTVTKFSELRAKADPFYSECIHSNGQDWRLKVYPDGNGVVRGTYLSVFLELTSGPPGTAKYEYRIEMIWQGGNDSSKNMVREFASDFEVSECWGYNRFFRLDLLESEGYLDPVQDTIKLRFDVRAPTYFQKCQDQQWYIRELINLSKKQSGQVSELKGRLAALQKGSALPIDLGPEDTCSSSTLAIRLKKLDENVVQNTENSEVEADSSSRFPIIPQTPPIPRYTGCVDAACTTCIDLSHPDDTDDTDTDSDEIPLRILNLQLEENEAENLVDLVRIEELEQDQEQDHQDEESHTATETINNATTSTLINIDINSNDNDNANITNSNEQEEEKQQDSIQQT